ncbi:MAG: serine hydrolase domain-containing protein, partial [Anaerolineales bacterium]
RFDGTFRHGFYGPNYDRLRGTYAAETIGYLQNPDAEEFDVTTMGIYGEAGADLLDLIRFEAGYFWPWEVTSGGSWQPSDEDELNLTATIREGLLPLGISASFGYRRTFFVPTLLGEGEFSDATLFDLASLTKLFTTSALLALATQHTLDLHTPLVDIIPEFGAISPRSIDGGQDPHSKAYLPTPAHLQNATVNPADVTLWHLLTHTSGLPPWRDVYTAGNWAVALKRSVAYPFVDHPGAGVRYSDIGFMLLGEVVARKNGTPLDTAIHQHVLAPLNLTEAITFNPTQPKEHIAPTELDLTWRKERVWGVVHDENACGVGGVAGHAGLFGTLDGVATFGRAWLNRSGLAIRDDLWHAATREQVRTGDQRRGLGWMLRAPQNASAGDLMSTHAYGHTGFTGTALWIDPQHAVVSVILTNAVYYGREYLGRLHPFRRQINDEIMRAIL